MLTRSKQRGVSIVEALLVITIGITIIAMSVRFITQNSFTAKVTQASTLIQQLTDASYQWLQAQNQIDFAGSGDEQAISLQKLSDTGLINFSCEDNAPCRKNPWGGELTVTPYDQDQQYVAITLTGVPKTACLNLTNRMQNTDYKAQTSSCDSGDYFVAL